MTKSDLTRAGGRCLTCGALPGELCVVNDEREHHDRVPLEDLPAAVSRYEGSRRVCAAHLLRALGAALVLLTVAAWAVL